MTVRTLASEISLVHGWAPFSVQVLAVVVLVLAFGRRSRRWWLVWVPVALLVGVVSALVVRWYVNDQGWTGDPPPRRLWLWVGLAGLAVALLALGWRGTHWWQRVVSALAIPMSVLCAAVVLNQRLAYLPTVGSVWDRVTGAPLSGQTDQAGVARMQQEGARPTAGTMVSVTIPDQASGFKHREELVYLPPAWYATKPPPRLPVVVMIHAEFGHPDDWLVGGNAQQTIDEFAAKHGGNTPVFVFVDSSGTFANDTECVNGPRGNAADHITKDVVPFVISNFGVSPDPSHWGIVGWSSGGTCAVMLTAKYPELFNAFIDIDGQKGPYAGTKEQTIARLFSGNAKAWAEFDPKTIMEKHGRYTGVAGWFAISHDTPTVYHDGSAESSSPPVEPSDEANILNPVAVANYMCQLASNYGIECAVVPHPGGHDFKNAGAAFASALPWLAGRLSTPGVATIPLPGAPAG